jgi:hypothetical protein
MMVPVCSLWRRTVQAVATAGVGPAAWRGPKSVRRCADLRGAAGVAHGEAVAAISRTSIVPRPPDLVIAAHTFQFEPLPAEPEPLPVANGTTDGAPGHDRERHAAVAILVD